MIKCFSLNSILPTESDDICEEEDEIEIENGDSSDDNNSDDGETTDTDTETEGGDSSTDSEGEESEGEEELDDDDDEPSPKDFTSHIGCASHTLQLVVNGALKADGKAKSFIAYINSVMVFFKKSTKWSDELRKETKVDVILPAKTRWNAILDMLGRFQKVTNYMTNNLGC